MKLHYLPAESPYASERWIAGIPASDFETDDQRVIETCLRSGLYEQVAEAPSAAPANRPDVGLGARAGVPAPGSAGDRDTAPDPGPSADERD